MDKKYNLQLFIAGIAPDTQKMVVDLKDYLNKALGEDTYVLKVVDVLEKPQLAEEEHILATPTVIRSSPAPIKKIILGSNTDAESLPEIELIIE
jgi:circadian clock protein KaiB